MADKPKKKGGIQKKAAPDKQKLPGLTDVQKAERALVSQGWPNKLVEALSEGQQKAIAATLDKQDLATPETVKAVEEVVAEYHEKQKAVVDKPTAADAPSPAIASKHSTSRHPQT